MSIASLFARFKAFFSSKPAAIPPVVVDESKIITTIRSHMAHLTRLSAAHHANYLEQWRAYTANIKAQTESVAFIAAESANKVLTAEYDTLRCTVLMQFSKYDNIFLDRGESSANWDALREDIIASRGSIGAHA